jgi:agmatine deiminase
MVTPRECGFYAAPEHEAHESTLVAWPAAADLWKENLPAAQAGFEVLCRAIASGERLDVLVTDAAAEKEARAALAGLNARYLSIPYGDIWLRDIAPIILSRGDGALASAVFQFNGWGGKYVLPHDEFVAPRIADSLGFEIFRADFVLEGGSVEIGAGRVVLTTEQCLLNENRNPGKSKRDVEEDLRAWLGAERIVWLREGLLNDHTDGHIDTLARFVRPGVVACMKPSGDHDPNAAVLKNISAELSRDFEVVHLPSPGLVLNEDGEVMPASYVNYYLANAAVIVPQYDSPFDAEAVQAVAAVFPERKTIGAPAKAILSGGGAFHCITQQVPRGAKR